MHPRSKTEGCFVLQTRILNDAGITERTVHDSSGLDTSQVSSGSLVYPWCDVELTGQIFRKGSAR